MTLQYRQNLLDRMHLKILKIKDWSMEILVDDCHRILILHGWDYHGTRALYKQLDKNGRYELIDLGVYDFPKYKYSLYGDRHIKHSVKVKNSSWEEYHVKNYDYYRSIQKREWNKTNCHNKMELMTRGRHKAHTYLNNIKKEYNSGYEEFTNDLLSDKIELFNKWDWRF